MPCYRYQCNYCGYDLLGYSPTNKESDMKCPKCRGSVKGIPERAPTSPAVVYNCDGFAAQEIAHDKHHQLVAEATEEGFTSSTEVEVAIEQGLARAEKLGVPPERIVGKDVLEHGRIPSLEDAIADDL